MPVYKKIFVSLLSGFMVILMNGCSSSVLVDEWNDPSFREAPLKKIFVIAIRKSPIKRRIWEDAFVSELSQHGIKATSSYHLFPDSLPDTNQVVEAILDKGFDGILITRVLPIETQTRYVQSYITKEQQSRYNVFRKRYDTFYRDVVHPGYEESEVINRRSIDVWVIRDNERMIWSATSNSPERNSVKDVQDGIANLVIAELTRYSIIKYER
jgi:hypothetical protein